MHSCNDYYYSIRKPSWVKPRVSNPFYSTVEVPWLMYTYDCSLWWNRVGGSRPRPGLASVQEDRSQPARRQTASSEEQRALVSLADRLHHSYPWNVSETSGNFVIYRNKPSWARTRVRFFKHWYGSTLGNLLETCTGNSPSWPSVAAIPETGSQSVRRQTSKTGSAAKKVEAKIT